MKMAIENSYEWIMAPPVYLCLAAFRLDLRQTLTMEVVTSLVLVSAQVDITPAVPRNFKVAPMLLP